MDVVSALITAPIASVESRQHAHWRGPVFAPIARDVSDNNAGGRPALAQKPAGQHVGFVTANFHFGGIEKCLVALAHELSKSGVTCHLFIYGDTKASASDWMFEPFHKVWILSSPSFEDWNGAGYLGSHGSEGPSETLMGNALGPLAQMDVMVNCTATVMFHGMASLRKRGVKIVNWEHITERSAYGRSHGSPFLTVGYEAGCDRILTCSQSLADRLAGQGVPRNKLLALPNGPGCWPCQMAPDTSVPPHRRVKRAKAGCE